MNLLKNPLVALLLPLLQKVGADPTKIASNFERDVLEKHMEHGVSAVTARMEQDGWTAQAKAVSPELERQLIRSALYLTLKESVKPILAKVPGLHGLGANVVADFLRDRTDDSVIMVLRQHISPGPTPPATPTADIVRMVNVAFCEHVF